MKFETNKFSNKALKSFAISLPNYFIYGGMLLLHEVQHSSFSPLYFVGVMETLLMLYVAMLSPVVSGISMVLGVDALKEIYKNPNKLKGKVFAAIGILLGVTSLFLSCYKMTQNYILGWFPFSFIVSTVIPLLSVGALFSYAINSWNK